MTRDIEPADDEASEWMENMRARTVGIPLAGLAGAVAVGAVATRAWLINWGATGDEIDATLPGDERISNVATQGTMAITIDAPPEAVWPWLVQMGVDRAGLYSYLFVENTLLRLRVTNADRIVPEWQELKVGDHIWFTPENYFTPQFGPIVAELDPNLVLVLCHGDLEQPCPGTWQFILRELPGHRTRLLMRSRSSADQPPAARATNLIMEPGYFVMDRGMLRGIKARAEACRTVNHAA